MTHAKGISLPKLPLAFYLARELVLPQAMKVGKKIAITVPQPVSVTVGLFLGWEIGAVTSIQKLVSRHRHPARKGLLSDVFSSMRNLFYSASP